MIPAVIVISLRIVLEQDVIAKKVTMVTESVVTVSRPPPRKSYLTYIST
jgi:hypothetical protein